MTVTAEVTFVDPDLPPETREAPPGPVGLSVVARVSAS